MSRQPLSSLELESMTAYKPVRDLPIFVRKHQTFSPTKLREVILSERNKSVTTQSISMWFKRHGVIYEALRKEVIVTELSKEEVSETIFQNGTFEQLPSIRKLVMEQTPRVSPHFLDSTIGAIKCICMGKYQDVTERKNGRSKYIEKRIEGWSLKHPDRLTVEHAKEYIALLHGLGRDTHRYRIGARAFFLSRDNITIKPTDIAGDKGEVGKDGKVFVPKEQLYQILNYVKERNFDFYVADHFSYKTATRLEATLSEAKKSNVREEDGTTLIEVIDKGLHRKGRQKWDKILPADLYNELSELFSQNGDRAFPNVNAQHLRELNKEAYETFLKDDPKALELGLKEPFHFWRHMFAQQMLRATSWNYDLVAELGGWSDTKTLKECYGLPPTEMIRKEGLEAIPKI